MGIAAGIVFGPTHLEATLHAVDVSLAPAPLSPWNGIASRRIARDWVCGRGLGNRPRPQITIV